VRFSPASVRAATVGRQWALDTPPIWLGLAWRSILDVVVA
jgi:hypothetical protein